MPDAGGRTAARLRLIASLPRTGEPTLAVQAYLLRYQDLDVESAQILAGVAVPSPESIPEGRCVSVQPDELLDEALAVASPESAVQLLDAGELVVHAAGRTIRLLPRYLPEIMPFVSGVFYDVEAAPAVGELPPELLGGGDVLVSAFGGEDVGRFDASATLPTAPRLVSVNRADPDGIVPIDRESNLVVRWQAPAAADEATLVVIAWPQTGAGEVRCRAPAGATALSIGRAALATIPEGPAEVAIERTARVPLSAAGLRSGEIEVSVRDVAAARVF